MRTEHRKLSQNRGTIGVNPGVWAMTPLDFGMATPQK